MLEPLPLKGAGCSVSLQHAGCGPTFTGLGKGDADLLSGGRTRKLSLDRV